jgi:hypothetical protein
MGRGWNIDIGAHLFYGMGTCGWGGYVGLFCFCFCSSFAFFAFLDHTPFSDVGFYYYYLNGCRPRLFVYIRAEFLLEMI